MIESQLDSGDVRKEVSDAVRQSQSIEIVYVSRSETKTSRVVEPVHQDESLFWAYCRLRQDWRCFRFDRVRAITSLPGTIPARSIPSDLTRFPWQSSGQSQRGRAQSSTRGRTATRRSSSQYRSSGSGCALVLAIPFVSLAILLILGSF